MQDGLLRQKKILQLIGAHKTRTAAYADCIGKLLYLRGYSFKGSFHSGLLPDHAAVVAHAAAGGGDCLIYVVRLLQYPFAESIVPCRSFSRGAKKGVVCCLRRSGLADPLCRPNGADLPGIKRAAAGTRYTVCPGAFADGIQPSNRAAPPQIHGNSTVMMLRTQRDFQLLVCQIYTLSAIQLNSRPVHPLQSFDGTAKAGSRFAKIFICFRLQPFKHQLRQAERIFAIVQIYGTLFEYPFPIHQQVNNGRTVHHLFTVKRPLVPL